MMSIRKMKDSTQFPKRVVSFDILTKLALCHENDICKESQFG